MFQHFRRPAAVATGGTPSGPTAGQLSRRSLLLLGGAGLASPLIARGQSGPSSGPTRLVTRSDDDEILDAREYGARGNGTADDTRALQRLIDASARRGAVAIVPAGTYRCTTG
ncbi:MAG TPA: glycosyl hydrolase family 28-related protein, partial [Blastococcus sp.]|nr:glycosyl hydrolase family 28-related protein [Blastococcus sp.]